MRIKQFPVARKRRMSLRLGDHTPLMRKLTGPTSMEARLRRYPGNKGSAPPDNVIYGVPAVRSLGWRYQSLLVDIMRDRRLTPYGHQPPRPAAGNAGDKACNEGENQ